MDVSHQHAIELILARNLLASLSTPAFLVNAPGDLIFYNEAAGVLLGRRFEEAGALPPDVWLNDFGPMDEHGDPIPLEEQPLTLALRANRPAHARHRIRSVAGGDHDVEVSGVPVIGADGFQGAMVFFWLAREASE